MSSRLVRLALPLLVALPLASASGQAAAAAGVSPKNVISIQPLSLMFTVIAAEYERKGGAAWTWGLGVTHWDVDDEDTGGGTLTYQSGDVKFRYYPQGTALQGFSFGGSVGFTQVKEENANTTPPTDDSQSGATAGVLLEYQWLMGAKKKFGIALGLGAKMLMIDEDEFSTTSDVVARYPTARVSVGWAF
jgi:hypothetical protein